MKTTSLPTQASLVGLGGIFALLACGPETRTINGKVLDALGQPLSGATVVAGGKATATSAAGLFTTEDVHIPYDITVLTGDHLFVFTYQALTRSDPTLPVELARSAKLASVSGQLTGQFFPQPGSYVAAVAFSSREAIAMSVSAGRGGSFNFPTQSPLVWGGPATTNGTLHALQWRVGSDLFPAEYQYGKREVGQLTDRGIYSRQDISLRPLANAPPLTGRISIPSDYSIISKLLYIRFDDHSMLPLLTDRSNTTSFSYALPNIAGASFTFAVLAQRAAGQVVVVKTNLAPGSIAVNIPSGVSEAQAPLDSASAIGVGTSFTWSGAGGTYELELVPTDTSKPTYVVKTGAKSFTLPDLTQYGVTFPHGANYRWKVIGDLTFSNSDAATGAEGLDYFNQQISNKYKRDFVQGASQLRSFTTVP